MCYVEDGIMINNLRYADDSEVMADSNEEFQNIQNRLITHCKNMASYLILKRNKPLLEQTA